jgi:hypothetical protein
MIRWGALSFAVILAIGSSSPVQAQMAGDPYGPYASPYGGSTVQIEPHGGFGLELIQAPMPGTVMLDRFGIVYGVPDRESFVRVTAPLPRARSSRSGPAKRTARIGNQLPTGSLDWAGASGVMLYSPAFRYQNYGGGYGRGPYGTMDCGMMYHGMSLGY